MSTITTPPPYLRLLPAAPAAPVQLPPRRRRRQTPPPVSYADALAVRAQRYLELAWEALVAAQATLDRLPARRTPASPP